MKKITLYGAATRNDGSYIDAGATLTIGDGADQIGTDRAKDLVDRSIAVSETAAKADDKAGSGTADA